MLPYYEGCVRLIPGSFNSDRPNSISGVDKIHLNCDCINGKLVNDIREHIFYGFALNNPPGHKFYKEPRIKLFYKTNNSVLSHITVYLEDDDHKPADLNGETISFTCQFVEN